MKTLILGFVLAFGSMGCGSSDSNSGTGGSGGNGGGGNGGSGSTTTDECAGAHANELVGSCTTDLVCWEEYTPSPPSADLIKDFSDQCILDSEGTWSSGKCTVADPACACNKTLYPLGRTVSFYLDPILCNLCGGRCNELL
jgi:hypothetical protein